MNGVSLAAIMAVLASAGLALAVPPGGHDDSARAFDLTPAGLGWLYIKCENGRDIRNCEAPSLWQEANGYSMLQAGVVPLGHKPVPPDKPLTP